MSSAGLSAKDELFVSHLCKSIARDQMSFSEDRPIVPAPSNSIGPASAAANASPSRTRSAPPTHYDMHFGPC